MTFTTRTVVAVVAAAALLAACGQKEITSSGPTSTTVMANEAAAPEQPAQQQPAIWPAADVVFATPEEAAGDFVTNALGVPPVLGEFRPGDVRSGEIEVFSPGEGPSPTPVARSLLLLRQLGPSDGWFVIGAVNENASITSPASGAEVTGGPLTVSGVARGFEAAVVVSAFPAGNAAELDRELTSGGAFETPEPYSVSLDLSGGAAGDVVVLLVRGGTGLETDPGDFGAIPVVLSRVDFTG